MGDFDVIDIFNTPGGMDQLKALGVRNVPVVAIGERFTFAQNLKDVARFLGVLLNREQLSPATLVERYDSILASAQTLVRQVPGDQMDERVIPNRPRLIRPFLYHIFRIGEAYLLAYRGEPYSATIANTEPPPDVSTPAQIAEYGERVREELAAWWAQTDDPQLQKRMTTYYGEQAAYDVFERTVWHSAQHCRQLAVILERLGKTPAAALTADQTAGLPLPEGIWE